MVLSLSNMASWWETIGETLSWDLMALSSSAWSFPWVSCSPPGKRMKGFSPWPVEVRAGMAGYLPYLAALAAALAAAAGDTAPGEIKGTQCSGENGGEMVNVYLPVYLSVTVFLKNIIICRAVISAHLFIHPLSRLSINLLSVLRCQSTYPPTSSLSIC